MKTSRFAGVALAALLQFAPFAHRVLPAFQSVATSPAAILFKWVVGAFAFAGSMHAVSAATATLVSAKTVAGTSGTRLSYQIRISDGKNRLPGSWLINGKSFTNTGSTTNGMPAGLSLGLSTAIISGTPTKSGNFPVTLTAYEDPGLRGAKLAFTVTFTIAGAAAPPVITGDPTGGSVIEGGSFTFQVAASGDAPLGYQWFHDTTAVTGATNATFTLPTVAASDAGAYTVTVANAGGSVTSAPANLVVQPAVIPTSITTPPVATSVHPGETLTLHVTVAGSTPFTYRWLHDGAVVGTSSPTLTLADASATDAGQYVVEVSGPGGNASSTAVAVQVIPLVLGVPSLDASSARLTLRTIPGRHYAIETSTDPASASWNTALEIAATSDVSELSQTVSSSLLLFWRARALPRAISPRTPSAWVTGRGRIPNSLTPLIL